MKLVIGTFNFLWILSVSLSQDTPVTCLYSKECVLPCQSTYHTIIHWYKDQKAVHSFYQNQDQLNYQDQEYKGRTSLFSPAQINNGNVSLLLKQIRIRDEGKYKCYAASETSNDEKFVMVSVEAPVKSMDIVIRNDSVTCSTSRVRPEPNVSWSSDPPAKEPINNTTTTVDDFYMVTSELKMGNIMNNYTYNCSIINKKDQRTLYTATLKQQVISAQDDITLPCPFTKDDTFILTFSANILRYNSQTSEPQICNDWKDKVSYSPQDGTVKLHNLNKEQRGNYTCQITTVQPTTLTSTEHIVSGNEATFKCPVTKVTNYNITLGFNTNVLKHDNQTSTKTLDLWKNKITLPDSSGFVKLHSLNHKEHSGTYTCKSSTGQKLYIIHTVVTLTGVEAHATLAVIISVFVGLIILSLVIIYVLKKRKMLHCYKKKESAKQKEVCRDETVQLAQINRET